MLEIIQKYCEYLHPHKKIGKVSWEILPEHILHFKFMLGDITGPPMNISPMMESLMKYVRGQGGFLEMSNERWERKYVYVEKQTFLDWCCDHLNSEEINEVIDAFN